jgi:hypothetical protein
MVVFVVPVLVVFVDVVFVDVVCGGALTAEPFLLQSLGSAVAHIEGSDVLH